ncbi:MAG: hypothetical protein ABWZ40_14735 [Caulobacterales bacterium]
MRQQFPLLTGLLYGLGVTAALLISPRKLLVIGGIAMLGAGLGIAHIHLHGL